MSKIKMEAKKIDTWTIDLMEEVEMVPCGEQGVGVNVKSLYIKSWSVAEHKKRFSSIQRLALAIKDLQLANTMKTLQMFGGDVNKLRSMFPIDENNVAEKVEPMEAIKNQIHDVEVFFRGLESETIFGLFKTFFAESTSKMVFVHEAMNDEHAISIDALFNMIAPEDLYYLFASFYCLFLEPLLTPRKR